MPMPMRVIAVLMLMIGLLPAGGVGAQGSGMNAPVIPSQVISEPSPLDGSQRQSVDAFVTPNLEALLSGDPSRVSEARDQLLTYFRTPGASESFLDYYSQAISRRIADALDSEQALVRVNAMILATRLTNPQAADLIRGALADPTPGVRYWAARALGQAAANQTLSRQQQLELLRVLQQQIDDEPSEEVVRQILAAMNRLDLRAAREAVLDALNSRVRFHIDRPQLSYDAEREAMAEVFRQIIQEVPSGTAEPQDLRQLARASGRYFNLISQQLNQGNILPRVVPGHEAMISLSQNVLGYSKRSVQAGVNTPDAESVEQALIFDNYDRLTEHGGTWLQMLSGPPFNFSAQDLESALQ